MLLRGLVLLASRARQLGPASCGGGRVDDVVLGTAALSGREQSSKRCFACCGTTGLLARIANICSLAQVCRGTPTQSARCPSRFCLVSRYPYTRYTYRYLTYGISKAHYGITGPTISRLQGGLPPRRTANCTSVATDAYRPRVMLTKVRNHCQRQRSLPPLPPPATNTQRTTTTATAENLPPPGGDSTGAESAKNIPLVP